MLRESGRCLGVSGARRLVLLLGRYLMSVRQVFLVAMRGQHDGKFDLVAICSSMCLEEMIYASSCPVIDYRGCKLVVISRALVLIIRALVG